MTLLDYYSLISIIYLCLLCVWHALVSKFGTARIDIGGLIGFSLLFLLFHMALGVQLYFIYVKLRRLGRAEKSFLVAMKESDTGAVGGLGGASGGGGGDGMAIGGVNLKMKNTSNNVLYV